MLIELKALEEQWIKAQKIYGIYSKEETNIWNLYIKLRGNFLISRSVLGERSLVHALEILGLKEDFLPCEDCGFSHKYEKKYADKWHEDSLDLPIVDDVLI